MNRQKNAAEFGSSNHTAISTEFYQQLLQFVLRRISNKEDAEEILQDVFLRLAKNSDSVGEGKVQAWLYSTARNAVIDFYRKRRDNKESFTDNFAEDNSEAESHLALCLEPLLKTLSSEEASVLRSVDLQGRSQKELATEKNLPYSSLKSQVQRAREKLKKELLNCCQLTLNSKGFPFCSKLSDDCC